MYKIIFQGQVIDILKELKYFKYLYKSKRTVITDSSSANCILGSDNKTLYGLLGNNFPSDFPYKRVLVKEIPQTEYDKLQQLLYKGEIVSSNNTFIINARTQKIEELKNECNRQITEGILVKLSDDKYHKFDLTIEDQLNLRSIQNTLQQNPHGIVYHEKGKLCKLFSIEDMKTIIQTANKHIQYHTTYFNILKYCINNMYKIETIKNVHYGDDLSNFNVSSDIKNMLMEI